MHDSRPTLPEPRPRTARSSSAVPGIHGGAGGDRTRRDARRGGIEEQTRQVLDNVERCLASAGCSMDDVVKVTAFLSDLEDFDGVQPRLRAAVRGAVPRAIDRGSAARRRAPRRDRGRRAAPAGSAEERRSEERRHDLDHGVVVVEDRDQPPPVEHRARVRDAAGDEIADAEPAPSRTRQYRCWSSSAVASTAPSRSSTDPSSRRAAITRGNPWSNDTSRRPRPTIASPSSGVESTAPHTSIALRNRPSTGSVRERRRALVHPDVVHDVRPRTQHQRRRDLRSPRPSSSTTRSKKTLPPTLTNDPEDRSPRSPSLAPSARRSAR